MSHFYVLLSVLFFSVHRPQKNVLSYLTNIAALTTFANVLAWPRYLSSGGNHDSLATNSQNYELLWRNDHCYKVDSVQFILCEFQQDFFSVRVFFHKHSRFSGQQGREGYFFNSSLPLPPASRTHLDIRLLKTLLK